VGDSGDYNGGCYTDLDGCLPLWDADVGDLTDYLDGGDLTFLFRDNDTGNNGELTGQDMQVWAQVCLSDSSGINETQCFVLGETTGTLFADTGYNDPNYQGYDGTDESAFDPLASPQFDAQVEGVNDILPTEDDLWAHVHSDLCILANGQVLLGKCSLYGNPTDSKTINQALGQGKATYAVTNAELNEKLYSGDYDVLTVDSRLAWLNNGGDWIGIIAAGTETNNPVPSPAITLLLGFGLASLGVARRTKRRLH
jgi:hypothetical protein